MNARSLELPTSALRLLAEAPHRLLFTIGAANLLLAMGWWTAWLLAARWPLFEAPSALIHAGWLHAIVMQYQVLPSFMFGFLLTVFPRWMNQPPLTRWQYLPVGIGLLGGQGLTLTSMMAGTPTLRAGAWLTIAGWSIGTMLLARLVWREAGRTWHAVSCLAAMCCGLIGLVLYAAYLHGASVLLMFAAIKIGSIAMLLPVFFTVCHRMIPFFAAGVIAGYQPLRPLAALAGFWAAALMHLGLEITHSYAWLWAADLPLVMIGSMLLWMWWPRGAAMPPLLRVLFAGFAWMPIAFALYAAQSLQYAVSGELLLGRAPAHALFIGYFTSLLVAMVTRVTQGHSGRPLVLGWVAGFAFVTVQLVAVMRVVAELRPDPYVWHAVAALGWMLAFTPWVVRSIGIYITPRVDGNPG